MITYIPPITKEPVTHRIISITRGPHGERVFRTKGDNNPAPTCARSRSTKPTPGPRRVRDPLPRLAVHPALDAGGADLPDRAARACCWRCGRSTASGARAASCWPPSARRGAVTTTATRLLAAAAWLAAAVDARAAGDALRRALQLASAPTRPTRSRPTRPANYLRLYSQSTDPAGPHRLRRQEELRARACPPPPARTTRSRVALGGFKNQNATTISRVLTLQALSPLPAGASPLTVTASLAADPVTGQPADHRRSSFSNTDGSGAGPTATLDRRRQAPGQPDGQDPAEQRLPGQQRPAHARR